MPTLRGNHDYKCFFRFAVNMYVPILQAGLKARGGRKPRTHVHTHTQDNHSNHRCAYARRGLIMMMLIVLQLAILIDSRCLYST